EETPQNERHGRLAGEAQRPHQKSESPSQHGENWRRLKKIHGHINGEDDPDQDPGGPKSLPETLLQQRELLAHRRHYIRPGAQARAPAAEANRVVKMLTRRSSPRADRRRFLSPRTQRKYFCSF